ncbi:MAG: hypothetical protein E3J56_06485 [Candidatus Aminicenantes bacterium]|nr:MAG: hypothetical protein E3J56_06485 [Candidatus Aminicenantes bacterium]
MQEYRVLYYPHFQPKIKWLKSILLFVDKVIRIVPSDVDPMDSDELKELIHTLPGCLTSISPKAPDTDIDDINLDLMNKAFCFISKKIPKKKKQGIELNFAPNGAISIAGHTFLHQSKVSKKIRDSLIEHKLLNQKVKDLVAGIGIKDYYPVPKQASNIILSYISDRIARRIGLDSVTDETVGFAVAGLDKIIVPFAHPSGGTEGSLLNAITSVNIPESVHHIALEDYKDLRNSYVDIRELFKKYVSQLAALHRLHRIEDIDLLEKRLTDIAFKIKKECDKYQNTSVARKFKKWAPFSLCSLLSVVATVVDPTYAVAFASGTVAIEFIKKAFVTDQEAEVPRKTVRMLAHLRKDIFKLRPVKALA